MKRLSFSGSLIGESLVEMCLSQHTIYANKTCAQCFRSHGFIVYKKESQEGERGVLDSVPRRGEGGGEGR